MTQPTPPVRRPIQPSTDLVTPDNTVGGRYIAGRINDYRQLLPSFIGAEYFVAAARSQLRKDKKLLAAAQENPESLFYALMECARLGHIPGDRYALVHFRNKEGGEDIVGIEQYQGVIDRMYRAGGVASVHAEVIRERDDYHKPDPSLHRDLPIHDYDEFATEDERGPLKGVYAYARLTNGSWSRVIFMNRETVMKHRAVAKTKVFWDGIWQEDMWIKTAVLKLKSWVPTSSDYLNQQAKQAEAAMRHPDPRVQDMAAEIGTEYADMVDGAVVSEEPR